MAKKVDFSLKLSVETAERFDSLANRMQFTRAQTLTYLLDLYDKVEPERAGFPRKRPAEFHFHTCVRPEVRTKFRQLAQEYDLNRDQMLSVLLDIHDQCPGCAASQLTWSSGMGTARAKEAAPTVEGTAKVKKPSPAAGKAGDTMAEVDAALDTLRRAFRSMATDGAEVASLREQLARSRAETREVEAVYRRTLQAVTAQLRNLA